MSNAKVIHGNYVENPKCQFCDKALSHEWIAGDYTLLICGKDKCWDELDKQKDLKLNPQLSPETSSPSERI